MLVWFGLESGSVSGFYDIVWFGMIDGQGFNSWGCNWVSEGASAKDQWSA